MKGIEDTFFELGLGLLCLAGFDGTLLKVSNGWRETLGYAPEELVGKNFFDLVHPDDIRSTEHQVARLGEGKSVLKFVNRYRHKDGSYRYIEWSSVSVPEEELIYANAYDVTENRNLHKQLAEQNQRLNQLLDIGRIGTWEVDLETGQQTSDSNWARMLGYSYEQAKEMTLQDQMKLQHPDDTKKVEEALGRHLSGDSPEVNLEMRLRHKDGHWIWVKTISQVVEDSEDGRPKRVMGTNFDITPMKKLEERLNLAFEIGRIGNWEMDVRQSVQTVDENWERILGYQPGEVKEVSFDQLMRWLHPDDKEMVNQAYASFLENSEEIITIQARVRNKADEWIDVVSTGKIVERDANGNPVRIIGTVIDVTQIKEMERRLSETNQRLELALEIGNMGIWETDLSRGIQKVDANWEQLLGYEEGEVGAIQLDDLSEQIHPDDREQFAEVVNNYLQGQKGDLFMQARVRHKTGRWVDVSARGRIVERDREGNATRLLGANVDVSELKQAERRLSEANQRLNLAMDIGKVGIYSVDVETGVQTVDERWEEILGYEAGEVGTVKMEDISVFIHPDDAERVQQHYSSYLAGKTELYDMRLRMKRKDGSWLDAVSKGRIVERNEDGSVARIMGAIVDVSSLARAEAELFEQKEFLDNVLGSIQDGIMVLNPDLTIRYANPVINSWSGVKQDLIGQKCHLCFHNSGETCHPCPSVRAIESGKVERDVIPGLDGSPITEVEKFSFPLKDKDGNITGVIEYIRDTTEQKKTRLALERSEKQYRTLVESISEGIGMVTQQEDILFMNTTGAEIFGAEPDDLTGRNLREFIVDNEWHKAVEGTRKSLEGTNGRYQIDIIAETGQLKTLEVQSVPMVLDENKPAVILSAFQDITQRKQDEQRLHELNAELEAFTYSVSHDLKAPLRQIAGFVSYLLGQSERGESEVEEVLERVLESAGKANGIIEDLLHFSRAQTHQLDPRETDLTRLAEVVADTIQGMKEEEKVSIEIEPGMLARADATLMMRVLENLIGNAVKYSSDVEKPVIRVYSHESDDQFDTFAVSDNGVGFDEEKAHAVFEPFVRLHAGSQYKGTGIGLSIVKRIIERHGGRVWAEGASEKGATFYFSLPK